MSGNYQNWAADAPGGLNESMQAVASGLAESMQAVARAQGEARTFFESYGPAVSAGHADVNAAGRQGDPDVTSDASDYSGG
jgi:hypothetical protein